MHCLVSGAARFTGDTSRIRELSGRMPATTLDEGRAAMAARARD